MKEKRKNIYKEEKKDKEELFLKKIKKIFKENNWKKLFNYLIEVWMIIYIFLIFKMIIIVFHNMP